MCLPTSFFVKLQLSHRSRNCQVIVVVKMHGRDVSMLINIQIDELVSLVGDVVLLEGAIHVQRSSETLPGVAGSVLVKVDVAVENLVERLLAADVNHVVVLGVQVDDPELACLLGQGPDPERFVLPPGQSETVGVPLGVGLNRRDVQVTAERAVPPVQVRFGVNRALGLSTENTS